MIRSNRLQFLLVDFGLVLCLGFFEAKAKTILWYSHPYTIDITLNYTGDCKPMYYEGERVLQLWANVRNVIFGHPLSPSFSCFLYKKVGGSMIPAMGHGDGEARIGKVEMCLHHNGMEVEPQRITKRNDNFNVQLEILPKETARELEYEEFKRKTGEKEDDIPLQPLVPRVWMKFTASTPFSNPAVEYRNSDGNGVITGFTVFFGVPLTEIMDSKKIIEIEVPYEKNGAKGKWDILVIPASQK